jgi:hypothetical protein
MTSENGLDLTKRYHRESTPLKPNGLWYSINDEWKDWCKSEMPEWIKGWTYHLKVDTSNMLILSTVYQLKEFVDQYSKKLDKYLFIINWWRVSQDYSGIEIRRYNHLRYMRDQFEGSLKDFNKYTWLHAWDVSGGCIWDLNAVKSCRRYKTRVNEEAG